MILKALRTHFWGCAGALTPVRPFALSDAPLCYTRCAGIVAPLRIVRVCDAPRRSTRSAPRSHRSATAIPMMRDDALPHAPHHLIFAPTHSTRCSDLIIVMRAATHSDARVGGGRKSRLVAVSRTNTARLRDDTLSRLARYPAGSNARAPASSPSPAPPGVLPSRPLRRRHAAARGNDTIWSDYRETACS